MMNKSLLKSLTIAVLFCIVGVTVDVTVGANGLMAIAIGFLGGQLGACYWIMKKESK